MGEATNIYPIYEKMMTRSDKEQLLGQRGVMVWFTGLSGSGKSTVALGVERELHKRGILCRILDGDNIRSGINKNLGFSADDRKENIRRIAEIGKLFVDTGVVTLSAFISPTNESRRMASEIIGADDFREGLRSCFCKKNSSQDADGNAQQDRKGCADDGGQNDV